MQKIVGIITFLIVCTLNGWAQIKINRADLPSAGDKLIYSTTTDAIDVSKTGANHSWDFSSITPTANDTAKYQNPAGLYIAFFFGNLAKPATVANTFQGFEFYQANSSEWKLNGFGFTIPILNVPAPIKLTDADIIYKFPLTYQDSYSDTFHGSTTVSGNTVIFKGKRNVEVDGYGSIKTPYGTFNCIRYKADVVERDTLKTAFTSIPLNNSRTEYIWLASGKKYPVMMVVERASPFGTTQTVTYLDSFRKIFNPNTPIVDFTADDSTISAGEMVSFTNKTSNTTLLTNYNWNVNPGTAGQDWNFVGGTTANTANPKIEFLKEGKYTIRLTASTFGAPAGQLEKKEYIIVSKALAPIVDFSASRLSAKPGQVITLLDNSTNNPKQWKWEITPANAVFVSGSADTSQNPQIIFSAEGKYSVKLIASNLGGSGNASKSDFLTIDNSVGIDELTIDNSFIKALSYPTHIELIKSNHLDKVSELSVYTLNGKKITSEVFKQSLTLRLDKGMYLLQIRTDNKLSSFKIGL